MACLIIRVDGREVVRHRLVRSIVIGRGTECDIAIAHPLLSRKHCRIDWTEKGWVIADLQSRNGVWLNDPIEPRMVRAWTLGHGDHLRLGIAHLFFDAHSNSLESSVVRGRFWRRSSRPLEPLRLRSMPVRVPKSETGAPRATPIPQPRPRDPAGFRSDNLYSLFTSLSVNTREPTEINRARPRPIPMPVPRLNRGSRIRTSLRSKSPARTNKPRARRLAGVATRGRLLAFLLMGLLAILAHAGIRTR